MNTDTIPMTFRHLLPYALKYGVSDFVDKTDQYTSDELLRFWRDFHPYKGEIDEWLSQKTDVSDWTEIETSFMYAQQALAYAEPITRDTLKLQIQNFENIFYPNQIKKIEKLADEAFQASNYLEVAELLAPYKDDLSKVYKAKYDLALKRSKK